MDAPRRVLDWESLVSEREAAVVVLVVVATLYMMKEGLDCT